jgi:Post-transcriptional regulator
MKAKRDYESFHYLVKPALISKQEEFLLLGYDNVSQEDIWTFLLKKKWQKGDREMKLFEVVQSILSLKVGELINYMSVEALKDAEFTFENEEERVKLLK